MTAPLVVLVTGASGGIGSRLLRGLGEQGWRRRCLVHRRPVKDADETVQGDLASPDSLRHAVAGAAAIVHLAAVTHSRSPSRYDGVNLVGTQNLLTAAREAGTRRFLFVSTRAISPDGGAYSRSKHRAEEAVRGAGVPWTIVRLPEVYGIGSTEGVDRILARVRHGGFVPMVGGGADMLCPAHVDDVVGACVRALEIPGAVGRTYTLAGPCLTMREFAELAGVAAGRRPRVLRVPVPVVAVLGALSRFLPLPLYPDQLARLRASKPPASAEAEADLAFRPRRLREGLRDCLLFREPLAEARTQL